MALKPSLVSRQADGEGPQLLDVKWGGQLERGSCGLCETRGPPGLASEDFECPQSETPASGPPRKAQEVLMCEPWASPVLTSSLSPTRLLGCALSHRHRRGCLPGPPLPPGLHVCWPAPQPPQVGEGASRTAERFPEGPQRRESWEDGRDLSSAPPEAPLKLGLWDERIGGDVLMRVGSGFRGAPSLPLQQGHA